MFCGFCGKPVEKDSYLLTGNNIAMCPDCIKLAYRYVEEREQDYSIKKFSESTLKPHDIVNYLNQYIIGQDEVKKRIAVAVYNHYKRLAVKDIDDNNVEIEKSNILILGPTGSGKTLVAKTIAKMLDVPFAVTDATSLTQSGYVGDDVENCISRLLRAANYDVEKAERGIVFLDEIDKIARKGENTSITRDVSGEGVQQSLLKIIEGTIVDCNPAGGRKNPDQKKIPVDTKNILFICGGAFEGLEDRVMSRMNKRTIGYNGVNIEEVDESNALGHVTTQDLRKFGLIPELIGRLPIVTHTNPLTKDDMIKILTEPKNAIVKQYQKLFELDGIKLSFKKNALEYIVEQTIEDGLGARGLRSVMETVMTNAMYDMPSNNGKEFTVTKRYAEKQTSKIKKAANAA